LKSLTQRRRSPRFIASNAQVSLSPSDILSGGERKKMGQNAHNLR